MMCYSEYKVERKLVRTLSEQVISSIPHRQFSVFGQKQSCVWLLTRGSDMEVMISKFGSDDSDVDLNG